MSLIGATWIHLFLDISREEGGLLFRSLAMGNGSKSWNILQQFTFKLRKGFCSFALLFVGGIHLSYFSPSMNHVHSYSPVSQAFLFSLLDIL